MNLKYFIKRLTIGLIAIIFIFSNELWAARKTLVIGSISDQPREEVAEFKPFIDYLVRELDVSEITNGEVLVASSMSEIIKMIKLEKVDLFIDSTFPTIIVAQQAGIIPFLHRWKKGVKSYHSVIFVNKDSGIESTKDLTNKIIAFEEKFSTSGYFLPKATLMKQGLKLTAKSNFREPVSRGEIGYVFSYDDENTILWVLRNKVAAGALSGNAFKILAKKETSQLKIIAKTIEVPRHIVSYRSGLNTDLVSKIEDILIKMQHNTNGINMLKQFSNTHKFEKGSKSFEKSFKSIKELVNLVEKEILQ